MSDNKQERLSYRITPELSDKIDETVKKYDEIKNRSDLGTRAILLYMELLRMENDIKQSVKEALVVLADEVGADELEEIQKLHDFIKMYDE